MARPLPVSLSPHVCILSSPDVDALLSSRSLPPLPRVLQSFSPLSQVTTRTTSLTTVSHASFWLRFSSLVEIERACKEDPARRAVRAIDWISARIARQCPAWVDAAERGTRAPSAPPAAAKGEDAGAGSGLRVVDKEPSAIPLFDWNTPTPWWDELKRCAEGDRVPSRTEGWNHPAAVLMVVSTMVPNPLQAVSALHARQSELPSWVDPTHLRYTLVLHPQGSLLSDEETQALFNAIRKQYGLNTYLLRLGLPAGPPPVVVPAVLPQLPAESENAQDEGPTLSRASSTTTVLNDANASGPYENALSIDQKDIQEIARFIREFVVQGLVPWMEKAVGEWNETYASSRRLPSRLFSSTRRLFGNAPSPTTPTATHQRSSTLTQATAQSFNSPSGAPGSGPGGGALGEQRRLAEFATVLGDVKLATSVWEVLRKDGRGGADVLPLLLAPGPGVRTLAQLALAPALAGETPPHVLLRTLHIAARWADGIPPAEFAGNALEGERWLVWAAGSAEEAPSALLLAHAAHLSAQKRLKRKAALLYLTAANRLEKCGIKPLTMHFLRRAHELYQLPPGSELSPSFWDADGLTPADWAGFAAIRPGIDSALARLLYTSGAIEEAARIYLRLLRPLAPEPRWLLVDGSDRSLVEAQQREQVLLDDFDVVLKHFLSTPGSKEKLAGLQLPINFCVPRESRVRLPRQCSKKDDELWTAREETWRSYWKPHGPQSLKEIGKAAVNETFWLDLLITNPLSVEVALSNFTVRVSAAGSDGNTPVEELADVEVLSDITLDPRETRTIPLGISVKKALKLAFTELVYDFMSLLPAAESLSTRGRRLHATPAQRQEKTYAPDVPIAIEVEDAALRLSVSFVDDGPLSVFEGEHKAMQLWLSNEGAKDITEIYLVASPEDEVVLANQTSTPRHVIKSSNSIASDEPLRVPLDSPLSPGKHTTLDVVLHAGSPAQDADLSLLFVYREDEGDVFYPMRVTRSYDIQPLFDVQVFAQPSHSSEHLYSVSLRVVDTGDVDELRISQVTSVSPSWKAAPVAASNVPVLPDQGAAMFFTVDPWDDGQGTTETEAFVKEQLASIVGGLKPAARSPPALDLLCVHTVESGENWLDNPTTRAFLHSAQRKVVRRTLAVAHPSIPTTQHPVLFPLYHPAAFDLVLAWEADGARRGGHVLVHAGELGARHGMLTQVLTGTATRSMYAETQAERVEMLGALGASVWNMEMDPLVLSAPDAHVVHDFAADGACHASVTFVVRNYSRTHAAQFTLKLPDVSTHPCGEHLLHPHFAGRRTFRGTLPPCGLAELRPRLWADRPGAYSLGGWTLESEVLGTPLRYVQRAPAHGRACMVVADASH